MENYHKSKVNVFIIFIVLYGTLFFPTLDEGSKDYAGIILILLSSTYLIYKGKFNIPYNPIIKFMMFSTFIITIFDLINLFIADSSWLSIIKITLYNNLPLISIITGLIISIKIDDHYPVDKILFFAGIAQSVFGILQHHFIYIAEWSIGKYASIEKYSHPKYLGVDEGFERVLGTFGNPNYYAIFVAWYLLLLCFYFYPKMNNKLIVVISILLTTYALVLSDSRTGFIVLLIIAFLFLNLLKNKLNVLVVYLIIILVILYNGSFFISIFTSRGETGSLGGRSYIWLDVVQKLSTLDFQIIFGVGTENVTTFIGEAHNFYLFELAQHGVIGLLLHIAILVIIIKYSLKCQNYYDRTIVLCTLLALIIGDFASEAFLNPRLTIPFFLIIGFYLSKDLTNRRRKIS